MIRLSTFPWLVLFGLALLSGGRGMWAAEEKVSAKVTYFDADQLGRLREKAESARQVPPDMPEGWTVSKVNPHDLVSVFKPLSVKRGVVLRAYQFCEGGNGNGVVWALPKDADFPNPNRCPKGRFIPELEMQVPRPPAAFASVMAHIDGDGSPWSHLAASVLAREITEFGALWHGNKWSTHKIVDRNPLQSLGRKTAADTDPMFMPQGTKNEWRWLQAQPDEWRPAVRVAGGQVTVVFYTFSGWKQQRIFQHTDRFTLGNYDCESDRAEIAVGPGGFMF